MTISTKITLFWDTLYPIWQVAVTKQQNVKKTTKGQKRKRVASESAGSSAQLAGAGDSAASGLVFRSRRPSVFTRVVGRKR